MSALSADRLADRLMLFSRQLDGGVAFCRRACGTNKAYARNQVIRKFTRGKRDGVLRILTMPSLGWQFERALLRVREHGKGLHRPRITDITSIEKSPFIWRAAMAQMPGVEDSLSFALPLPPFAQAVCRTQPIKRFYHGDLDGLARHYTNTGEYRVHAAWVDLTGPLSLTYLDTLAELWRSTTETLIVTSLRARWSAAFCDELSEAGSIAELLMRRLPDSIVMDEYTYADGSPMHQVTLRRIVELP